MRNILLVLLVILNTSQLYAAQQNSCIDEKIARKANNYLNSDPLNTKIILSSVPDCDGKYALMHKANVEIAKKCRTEFYYQDKINSRGWYDEAPNKYEKHVMQNPDQFESAREGTNKITANDYWIKKIKDTKNAVIANYEYQQIKLLFNGVWEDGDGSTHSYELVKEFMEWMRKYPDHAKVPDAKKLIDLMKDSESYQTQKANSILGILIPESSTTGCLWVPEEQDSTHLQLKENLKGIRASRTDNQTYPDTVNLKLNERKSVRCTISEGIALDGLSFKITTLNTQLILNHFYFVLKDSSNINQNKFRYCLSREGIHFYVMGKTSEIVWREYAYLGYTVEPTCDEEILKSD